MKSFRVTLTALTACLGLFGSSAEAQLFTGSGRIAVSVDGNVHDEDDFGATPMTLAILAKRGLQDKLVHYDYGSHIGTKSSESSTRGEREMETSALGAQSRFGFDRSVFFDDTKDLSGAVNNIRDQVNASSAGDRLYFILAGPVEVVWRGINAAQSGKRQFVTVISHSHWNENHANNNHLGQPNHNGGGHSQLKKTRSDLEALGVDFRRITNQNDYFNTHLGGRGGFGALSWLRDHSDPNLRWVFSRIQAVGRADYSDSGMAFWLVTGNDRATTAQQRDFFGGDSTPPPSGTTPPAGNTALEFRHSGKCFDLAGGKVNNGATFQQWACANNHPNQSILFTSRGGGFYSLKVQRSGRCVDLANGATGNGAKIHQWDCWSGNQNQHWKITPKDGAWFELRARKSNKCLDIRSASKDNGAVVQQWACVNVPQQQMKFK